ncbi:angiopoietin-related protein 2-like [Strongylocentrotus purpuratus]|uniref:Fibrinogen C-terminal domain-containing protein n=1 Tax=Strongylocentrotus purpuratus TaxID=7668 RepID=A0A7M7NQ36_STRPU|nr:angiopoietin-related protein 2-like [Strongylocentrotus purpuratus]
MSVFYSLIALCQYSGGRVVIRGSIGKLSCSYITGPMKEVINLVPTTFDLRPLRLPSVSYVCTLPAPTNKTSCEDYNETNHVSPLNPGVGGKPFYVYCEKDDYVIIQRRTHLSVDFNRSWIDYLNGFGDLHGDHWLGLQKILRFTQNGNKTRSWKIMVTFEDGEVIGATFQARIYADFTGSFWHFNYEGIHFNSTWRFHLRAPGIYPFATLGTYMINSSDSSLLSGEISCPVICGGGWWYNTAQYRCLGNINGILSASTNEGTERSCGWPKRVVKTLLKMRVCND